METPSQYDYLIVGAGPAGCALASQLAASRPELSILLVEAGGENKDVSFRIEGNKFIHKLEPSMAWGYSSVPQDSLSGRTIELDRGKGLGGSSAINFTCWTVGPRDDWDTIARMTGDDSWRWEEVRRRFKGLLSYHAAKDELPAGAEKYVNVDTREYGDAGPLHVGLPRAWDHDITAMMDIWSANGFPINKDISGGECLGVCVSPQTSHKGHRSTAADLLVPELKNLHRMTGAHVHKVLFEGKRAVGVALVDGTAIRATREVILSAGSLDTPKILMHSGIGPAGELAKFGIPVVHENDNVGGNFQDHYHVLLKYKRAEHTSRRPAYFRDKARQAAAMQEWQETRTGELASLGLALGFFKNQDILESDEFARLPPAERGRLMLPTVPSYEVCFNATAADYYLAPETAPALTTVFVFLLNSQGRGRVRLQSADPAVPLAFDPSFLEHPYDKRVAIEATRETMKVTRSPEFQQDNLADVDVPKSDSDEDILQFWRDQCTSTWHMSSTCRMGKDEKADGAVVDPDFKVFGLQGLRVVDMSVVPIIARCVLIDPPPPLNGPWFGTALTL